MNLVEEQNEIAGGGAQKLPLPLLNFGALMDSAGAAGAGALSGLPAQKRNVIEQISGGDFFVAGGTLSPQRESISEGTTQPATTGAAERLGQMIASEAVTIRKSGAGELSVSLKLDAQTELSLHLRRHDGQIQATLSCEKGDLSSLGRHWEQLQESLARHNVQLLPLESRFAPGETASSGAFENSSPRDFDQPARDRQPQPREFAAASTLAGVALPGRAASPNPNARTPKPQGWESWA